MSKDKGSGSEEWAGIENTGASTQAMDRNTALEETKIRCIITAKDKEKPMAFKKRLFCQYHTSLTKRCTTSQLN